MGLFRLTFNAFLNHIDTDERLLDPSVLALLEKTPELGEIDPGSLDFVWSPPGLELYSVDVMLRWHIAEGLTLEVSFETNRTPTAEDRYALHLVWRAALLGGWGTNYEFDLPAQIGEDYVVQFDEQPREGLPESPSAAGLERLVEPLRKKASSVHLMSDDELSSAKASLDSWDGPRNGEPYVFYEYQQLTQKISGEISRRAVAKRQAAAGTRPINLADNLDAIDDLPDDFF